MALESHHKGWQSGCILDTVASLTHSLHPVFMHSCHVSSLLQKQLKLLWKADSCLMRHTSQVHWCAADFTGPSDALPRGDCYALGRILHDWEDARCAELLRTVHSLLPPGGWLRQVYTWTVHSHTHELCGVLVHCTAAHDDGKVQKFMKILYEMRAH